MNCKKCKKEIPEEAAYCPWCGKKQAAEPRAKKRANGMGSVYKLKGRKTKPWSASVTVGKARVFLGTFSTETEARRAVESAQINGVSTKNTYTLETLYQEWSDVHFRKLSASGAQGYKTAWKYLRPIAKMKVRELRTVHFQDCLDECAQQFSRAQCEKIRQLVSQLCKKAMEYDLLNKNYAQFLVLPKDTAKERDIFTTEEIELLMQHADDERARIVLTLIYTGFRPNELFSLEIANVDLQKRTLCGGSKTKAGMVRTIPILPVIYPFVETWYKSAFVKDESGKLEQVHRYLLANQNGGKPDVKNFRARQFYPLLLELGILSLPPGETAFSKAHPPRLTPYCTRHTFASLATLADIKPEILQALMGHEDYTTTVNYYEHFSVEDLRKELEKLQV